MASNPFHDENAYYEEKPSNPFTQGRTDYSHMTDEELRQKSLQLQQREQQIEYRERMIGDSMQEVETLKANEKKLPNWPKCRPLIYHNIRDEIPEGPRNLVKRVYFSWFCNMFALFINMIALLAGLIANNNRPEGSETDKNIGTSFGISIALLVIGIPISFVFWYRPLYVAAKNSSGVSYFFFFFNYTCQLGFCIVMAIGPPSAGAGGLIVAISYIGFNLGAGALLFISSGIWILLSVFTFIQLASVFRFYRSSGRFAKDKSDLAKGVGKEAGKAMSSSNV